MQEFLGEKLDIVVNNLTSKGINYKVIDNNFNVVGDQKLVTNIYTKDNMVIIVTGNFIFNVRNRNNGE